MPSDTNTADSEVKKLARDIADRQHPVSGALWGAAYVAAVAALLEGERRERERCAQIAENYPSPLNDLPMALAIRSIAAAIRSAKP